MKKYTASLVCIGMLLGSASGGVLFSEDFQTPTITGDTPISDFGWRNDIQASDSRVYVGNSVWSWGSSAYTEAFYTTEAMEAGFTGFDLATATGLTFAVDSNGDATSTAGYFALQLDGGTNWFVSITPFPPAGGWMTRELEIDPTASAWHRLIVSGTGSVGAGGATIGSNPASDLSGTVTGVGYVIVRTTSAGQNFDNFAVFTPDITDPPLAPTLLKVWMNGTTAKVYWDEALSATNYIVKSSLNPGGPYTPVGNTNGTSLWITNLVVGTTNYFVVTAENEVGESDPSLYKSGVAREFTIIADSETSWGDWLYSYKEAAFDGDTGTYYESAGTEGIAYVGADYGAGNEFVPAEILYFPRPGYESVLLNAQFEGSNDGTNWVALSTITTTPDPGWNSVYPETSTAYRSVRLTFVAECRICEIAFGTNVPPFKAITVSPAAGDLITGPTNITLTAEIVEWNSDFDSAQLYLNDALVASNYTPSVDGTNLLVYPAGELDIGIYTGRVVAAGINPTATVTNEWTFEIITTPSPTALKLWNINMAGNDSTSTPVADGTVIRAPSTGLDGWNNLISPYDNGAGGDTNEFTWLPTNALPIVDANGGNAIGLKWTGTDLDWSQETTPNDDLFIGYFGSAGFNNTMEISGLDPDAKYDIYCYFTWGWNENWVTYQITEGTGAITNLWFLPERDNVASGTYSNLVRRQNYIVFTQLTPSPAGNIHVNVTSDDGGWSGIQIAEVPGAGPSVNPVIQSISMAGDIVTLQWASETGINYSILRKISLSEPSWTMVTNNISGSETMTSDSVQASGADEEFYIVEGQ